MSKYKGIEFREGYKSFPEFKKELEGVWIFREMSEPTRETELKKAYKIATGKNADDKKPSRKTARDIEVTDPDELSRSVSKGGKAKPSKDKQ